MGNDAGGALVGSAMGPGCDGKRSWEALLGGDQCWLGSEAGKRNQCCWACENKCREALFGSAVKLGSAVEKRGWEAMNNVGKIWIRWR